tara:strand:- start:2589 stop:2765 length:177 start_codon:yes stop_codon:yes gene_type:complete
MSWFNIIKNKQTKLPEKLTEGAQESTIDAKDWFIDKKKPKKKLKNTTIQSRLDLGEEE